MALPCWTAGFAIVFGGFLRRVYETSEGVFPAEGVIDTAVYWETTWCNDTLGVALMTIAWILMFRKITADGTLYRKVIFPISKAGYGVYLSHMIVLVPVFAAVRGWLGSADAGVLGFWTTPVEILLSAVLAFVATSAVAVLIQRIPKVGKYIVG